MTMRGMHCRMASIGFAGFLMLSHPAGAAPAVQLLLPLGRSAYQTNERIDIAVVRSDSAALAASSLTLNVRGEDGTHIAAAFPAPAAGLTGAEARTTAHLNLNGWLLRPGRYTLEVASNGATAKTDITLYSHIRKSSFRIIDWGRAKGADQLKVGEDGLGYNLFYGNGEDDSNFLRAGVDYMSVCTMSGGHQMDLRGECDWSDPYVTRGGRARVVRQAFLDRTRSNVIGVHYYDEPGLTWGKDPATGEMTPHAVPAQFRSFQSAFDVAAPNYHKIDPNNPADVALWKQWATWKLGFMDAAWQEAQLGVSYVRPDYISATQSQYGWSAFTDGYYFNVARSLPVTSGHGGYDDFGPGYFNPSYFLEMARARDYSKPNWYLPTWYGATPPDRYRFEQYASFLTNLQGMMSPPDMDPYDPAKIPGAESIVETNKAMARLGTIFTTMPVTRQPVAMLYSLSDVMDQQVKNRKVAYVHDTVQGRKMGFTYLAGKLIQQPFMTVVDEDVVDGTLAANHRAVILTAIKSLDPKVVAGLENFAAHGGLVLVTSDTMVPIKGALDLGVTPDYPEGAIVKPLLDAEKYQEAAPYTTMAKQLQGAAPFAKALKIQLDKAGIQPAFETDAPGMVAGRQAYGDIEYIFALNGTKDEKETKDNRIKAVVAKIGLAADGRQVYNAMLGGAVPEFKSQGGNLVGNFRFGPGEMRVFARTTRPIGGVKAGTPILVRDYTRATEPVRLEVAATLEDDKGEMLSGSAPLQIRVTDPLGGVRYELYRATDQGVLKLSLPLALNDPVGQWKLMVRDLLANTESTRTFTLKAVVEAGPLLGATDRAVAFGADRKNIFRFFKMHQDVTIVKGSGAYDGPAAERLAGILTPWGVRCKIVAAAEIDKPRVIADAAKPTLVGIEFGGIKTPQDVTVGKVGFAVDGPVILLGTPEDNPLIKYIAQQKFLPYAPDPKSFPGQGRGMISWQLDAVGLGQESVTLLAYDAMGMSEAVGSTYEAAAGMDPLTPYTLPENATLTPATTDPDNAPEMKPIWQTALPDRALSLTAQPGASTLNVVTWDGSVTTLNATGGVVSRKDASVAEMAGPKAAVQTLPAALVKNIPPGRIVKRIATNGALTAVGYWGGTLQVWNADGTVKARQQLQQDISGLAWMGADTLVVALSDGRVLSLKP